MIKPTIQALVELCHHRWSVPTLAQMEATGGSRVAVLVHALGGSRDAIRSALGSLVDLGLVIRNPGYGHPLRAEYVLTEHGRVVASESREFAELITSIGINKLAYRKWSAPLLLTVNQGHHRFGAIQSALDVTPRALTTTLRAMDKAGLIYRRIDDGYPPRAEYFLSAAGKNVAEAAESLASALVATPRGQVKASTTSHRR